MSITWNGVSSDTIGVIVERIPNRYVPTRRFSPQQVAGRNGNILLVDKSFPNVEQEYEVYLSAEAQGLPSVARACAEWLMGPDGYCRLEDSYDTTVYREAFLMGGYDLENILNKFGRCTITFSCKPQKYLLTGDTPISIPAGSTTTYTGSSVQFDGVTGASITSLSTTITPTQDLHGYANPWPGGGGKNKLNPLATYKGVGYYTAVGNTLNPVAADKSWQDAGNDTFTISDLGSWAQACLISDPLPLGKAYVKISNVRGAVKCCVYVCNGEFKINRISYARNPVQEGDTIEVNTTFTNDDTYFVVYLGGSGYDVSIQYPYAYSGDTAATDSFTPYYNICPISGLTGLSVYVSPTQNVADATTYTSVWTSQAGTVYGGSMDVVTGVLTSTMANIASYNGESINEPWLSSMDAYAPGATPTTGAQVVYTLSTTLTYQLTPQEIGVLVGENNVWTSSGPVTATVVTPLGGIVTNPTPFEARPLLTVSGVGEITINGKSIQILEAVSDFEIDCETMEAEDNSKIYCMDFPELSGGENEIVGDGYITVLTVTPRWWTL